MTWLLPLYAVLQHSAQKPEEEGCAGLLEVMRDIITKEGAGESPQGMYVRKSGGPHSIPSPKVSKKKGKKT